MRLKLVSILLLLLTTFAFAQGGGGSVLPQGAITPGDCAKFGTSKYFITDAGPCGGGTADAIQVGETLIISGSNLKCLFDNAGVLGEQNCATTPTGQALTRTNDTNVTLTLGGAPTVALLSPSSITVGWSGQLGLSRGGTNADLSATGGTSRVLKQVSVGAAVTVAQLACSDLSTAGTGCSSVAGITALTGDVTATGPGSVTATLATVNSNVGTFGSDTQVGVFQVNGKGLIVSASNISISYPGSLSGFAIPTVAVGISPANSGVLTTALRSDAKLILDQTQAYAFSGLGATTISAQGASASALTLTGGTVTTSQPLINATQTFNAGAITFTGWKFNVTNTASAAASKIVDFQINNNSNQFTLYADGGSVLGSGSLAVNNVGSGQVIVPNAAIIGWAAGGVTHNTGGQTFLYSNTAATLQLGAANAASPVAQTLQVQSVVAGTSNISASNFTIQGSLSTGSGVSGDIIFKSTGTGAAATTQNVAVNALAIKGANQLIQFLKSYTVSTLPTCNTAAQGSWTYVTDALAPAFLGTLVGGGVVITPSFCNGTNWVGG